MTDQTARPAVAPTAATESEAETARRPLLAAATVAAATLVNQDSESPVALGASAAPRQALRRPRIRRAERGPRLPSAPAAAAPRSGTSELPSAAQPDTTSELRNWIKDNATLLSNASLLISIAALALTLLPGEGLVEPYIQALLFAAALVLLLELHHQWPQDLQLLQMRAAAIPENHSWRMTGFAFLFQIATFLFVIWAILTTPIMLFPLTAIAVVIVFRRLYFRRFGGRFAQVIGILSLLLVLLLSELFMLIAWAAITDQTVTIELWTDERSDIEDGLRIGD